MPPAASRTHSSPRVRPPRHTDIVVVVVSGLAALAGDLPTLPVDESLWRAAWVVLVALAGREADRRTHAVLAGAAVVLAGGQSLVLALLGLAGAAALALAPARPDARVRRPLGAAAAGLAALALTHQADRLPTGWATVVALVASAPLLWTAATRLHGHQRRILVRTLVVTAAVLAVVVLGGLFGTLRGRQGLDLGARSVSDGLARARQGDIDEAIALFDQAEAAFDRGTGQLEGPVTTPARWLPVVGDNLDAAASAGAIGADLAASAQQLAGDADYRSLTLVDGAVDLDEVAAMVPAVQEARGEVQRAGERTVAIDRTWLVPFATARLDELATRIDGARTDLVTAEEVLGIMPALLGGEGTTHWYVMFAQPAESRFGGGFVAEYALLEAAGGRVEVIESGSVNDLTATPGERVLEAPDWFARVFARYDVARFFHNGTVSADFPTSAAVTAALVPQAGRPEIDGVIYLDPAGIAGLLELTGPVEVEGIPEPISAGTAEAFLLAGQYELTDDRDERKDLLHEVGDAAFDALLTGASPGPGTVGQVLGPLVAEGHISVVSMDPDANAVLDGLGLTGRFAPPADSDWVSVRTANADANKLDAYLERSLDYDLTVDDDGALRATATVTLRNNAPAVLPAYVTNSFTGLTPGTNLVQLSLYTPHEVTTTTLDGVERKPSRFVKPFATTFTVPVELPRGETRTLVFELEGVAPERAAVTVLPQASAIDLEARVSWRGGGAVFDGEATVAAPRRFGAAGSE